MLEFLPRFPLLHLGGLVSINSDAIVLTQMLNAVEGMTNYRHHKKGGSV